MRSCFAQIFVVSIRYIWDGRVWKCAIFLIEFTPELRGYRGGVIAAYELSQEYFD